MLPKIVHPIHRFTVPTTQKELKFRPFLIKEEKLLLMAKTSSSRSDTLNAIKQVVNNCLLDEGVDIEKFALVDIEWLFLKLRAISVNNTVKIAYTDNEDGKNYDFEIDLNDVKIHFTEDAEPLIPVSDTISVLMRYPEASLYSDEEFLKDQSIEYFVQKTLDKIITNEKTYDAQLENGEELKSFVESIPSSAFEKIQKFWASIPHLSYEIKYTNSMGSERTIPLTTLEDFFTF